MRAQEENASVEGRAEGETYLVSFRGRWTVRARTPAWPVLVASLREAEGVREVTFDFSEVSDFDSILVAFVLHLCEEAEKLQLTVDRRALPRDIARLLELARTVPERVETQREGPQRSWLTRLGEETLGLYRSGAEVAAFTGEWTLGIWRLLRGQSRLRGKEFGLVLESVSVSALPIVSLISFLVGVIISFLGAVTLRQFGAEFAVSYLVGYGMLREMGAVMTGIIMAGRTGAAFAAQIGSMKANEEIDALRTFGISPIDFIVLPRILALLLMMPLLTIYADVIGIFSGWLVAEFLMGVPGPVFFAEMNRVVDLSDFFLGVVKGCVFGLLVGTAGCLRGLQAGAGADAVGHATTRAVVTGITLIIFANAVIDWAAAILDV